MLLGYKMGNLDTRKIGVRRLVCGVQKLFLLNVLRINKIDYIKKINS